MRDQHFFTSVEKAMRDLDWKPEFDMLNGLKDSYAKDFGCVFVLPLQPLSPLLTRFLSQPRHHAREGGLHDRRHDPGEDEEVSAACCQGGCSGADEMSSLPLLFIH
jgi:hypothetical protein